MNAFDQFGLPLVSAARRSDATQTGPDGGQGCSRVERREPDCLDPMTRAVLEIDAMGSPLPGQRSSRPCGARIEGQALQQNFDENLPLPPRKKTRPRAITLDELLSVVAYSDEISRCPLSDRAKLLMSYYAGMRPLEIAQISKRTLHDANWNLMEKIIIHPGTSKRGRGREIPMHHEIATALSNLFEEYPRAEFAAFTIDRTNNIKYQTAAQVTYWFNKLYWDAGLRNVTGMSGRHAFAQRVEEQTWRFGLSIETVQTLLGHANLRTTEFYLDQ